MRRLRWGRARVDALKPFKQFDELSSALAETSEAIELRSRGGRFSFADVTDPGESIARLKIEGSALEPLAILDLVILCNAALDARNAILAERDNCPQLFQIVAVLSPDLKKLSGSITKKDSPRAVSLTIARVLNWRAFVMTLAACVLRSRARWKISCGVRQKRFRKNW
jgi:dsDNA-specific endonuclease/ATPase MutS2